MVKEATLEQLQKRIEKLEAVNKQLESRATHSSDLLAIMNLHSLYIHWLETHNGYRIWKDLWCHDDPRMRVELTDSGVYEGPESVRRMYEAMLPKGGKSTGGRESDPRGVLNTLFIATPYVVVARDGKTAKGAAHVFGPHSMDVTPYPGDQHKLTAYWFFGKYDNEYIKIDNQWKFLSLRCIVIFRSPYDEGWLRQPDCRRFPPPGGILPDRAPTFQSYHPDGILHLPEPPEEY